MTLPELEMLTQEFSRERDQLAHVVESLNAEIAVLKRKALPSIRIRRDRTLSKQSILRDAIEESPQLFVKPRTLIIHGVKIGFRKSEGTLEIPDLDRTVKKIRALLDCPENYIRCKETMNKEALAQLPAAMLKQLGCLLIETGDEVVIRPTDSEVDKLVDLLLRDEPKESEARAA